MVPIYTPELRQRQPLPGNHLKKLKLMSLRTQEILMSDFDW